jgi:hypothetical protein
MTNTVDRSFKYAMMDTVKIYIGGRMTYQEMIEWEDVPFKIKAIVNKEFVPDAGGTEFTFEEHLKKLKKESYAFQVFKTLKTKVKVDIPVIKKKGGKESIIWQSKIMPFQDYMTFMQNEEGTVTTEDGTLTKPVTEEISFSKLAVMVFSA